MTVFLLILKIIGITLLSILGLILAVLLLVLFVPIRYRIYAEKHEETNDYFVRANVTWLLHFLNILIRYSGELYYRVRITVFTIKSSDKDSKSDKKNGRRHRRGRNKEASERPDTAETENTSEKLEISDELEISDVHEIPTENDYVLEGFDLSTNKTLNVDLNSDELDEETIEGDEVDSEEPPKGILAFISKVLDKMFDLIDKAVDFVGFVVDLVSKALDYVTSDNNIVGTITNKVKGAFDNIEYYISAIEDERNQEAIALCINELSKVLKNIKPKVFKGRVHLGFEDAYTNGKVAAIFGMVNPFVGNNLKLISDFENEVIEGNLLIKGRITVFVALMALAKIYFSKNVKRMTRIFKKEGR